MSDDKPKPEGYVFGRPTKYGPEILEQAQWYLEHWQDEEGIVIPCNAGLALHLGIRRETVQVWQNEEGKEHFSNILDQIQAKQARLLKNKGLSGDFNSNITKLILGKHGFHEKQDVETTGKDGGPIENKWIIETIHAENPDSGQNAEDSND